MKLLTKINLQYLIFSTIIFILTGVAIAFLLNYILAEEMDEKLIKMSEKVTTAIHENNHLPEIPIYIEVSEIPNRVESSFFSDTTILDEKEKENEVFRQLKVIKHIENATYKITVRESRIESEELFESIAQIIGAIFLVLLISLFVINYRISRRVWSPFKSNLSKIRQFSISELSPISLNKTGITEFEELNSVITSLTEKAISDFTALKQFSEDASHEIQTPLAIISGKLENLMNDNRLNDDQLIILKSIYTSALRLSKLNKSLILLTKIENRQFTDSKKFSLKELIQAKLEEFRELTALNQLKVSTKFTDDIEFEISASLIDILLNNLISNSINHNRKGGMISVEICGRNLSISNSGTSPISDPDRIFNRFFKEKKSSGSLGLGLAIVKKICDKQHLEINYSFSNQLHVFTVEI